MTKRMKIAALVLIVLLSSGVAALLWLEGRSAELSAAERAVVINEVMSSNKGAYLDDEGKSSDWVEIYNPSDEEVNLSRFSLSDDSKKLDKWTFPDITLKPYSYIVVFLSGKSKSDTAGSLHAPFKLNAKGDRLILSANGSVVISVELPPMDENISYVRMGNQWMLSSNPTPGQPNQTASG